MQVSFTENGTVLTGAVLNIQKTFECGQCFRFIPDGDGYSGVAFGSALNFTQDGDAAVWCAAAGIRGNLGALF